MAVTYASNMFTVTPNTSTAGTGTITATATTVTINNVVYTATQVTGSGTAFTTQLVRGSLLSLTGFSDMIVYSITSNTSLIALKQDYNTNAQVIGTATAFTFRAPTLWTDLVASVTSTNLPAVASTDGRLNINFTTSSVTIQANAVLISADNFNISFGNASGYRMNIASAGSLIMRNGGRITYNGNVGFAFFAGTIDCWSGRFIYQANQTVNSGRQDFFDPTTMNSHFISAMDVVFSGGTSGCSTFIHLERLGGKVSELKMFNQMSLASTLVLIQFDAGTYPNVTFPTAVSSLGVTSNLGVYLARSGGTSTLVKPSFPGSSFSIANPGITGNAYIIDEIWPENGGAVGTLNYSSGSTTIYRQFTWYPGTYFTEGGWNVYLRDSQSTPAVVQSGVVTSNAGILMTWRKTTGTVTNYYPFKLTARKAGYIGKYETFTPIAPRTENFLPEVDATYTSNQSGLSGISANNLTNTITSSSNMTLDQRYDWFQYWMALTPQMVAYGSVARVDSVNGTEWTLPTGWTDSVTAGTLSAGAKLNYEYAPTFTVSGTGAITAIYANTTGTSTVLELNTPSNGYSLCIFKADGTTKYFASNVNTGSYYVYFAPSEAGTYYLGAENYGQKRTADTLVLSGGNVWYNITDQEDVGITDSKATASAYTTLSTTSQIYDATAYFRLSETGIKLGQLCTRDGLYLDFGTYNVKIKDDASAIVGVASGTITYKSIVVNETTKYNAMKATPPKTITPTDTEIINVLIEDANGDSKLAILGGDNLGYELWKVTTATATDDYATGTLLTTLATNDEVYRFIGISGYDIVGRDTSSGVRRRSSMLKGSYEQAFYVGNQIQLATDAPQLIENNNKLDELILKIDTQKDPLTLPQFIALK